MSVYIFALGIKSANGLVKSTINTANAFADSGVDVSIINIVGVNGGFSFLDPGFPLDEKVKKYSLDAMSELLDNPSLKSQEFHSEQQQFLKAYYHNGHRQVLQNMNDEFTENDLIIFTHPLALVLFAKANPNVKAKMLIQVHGNYIEEVDNLALLADYSDYVDYIQTVSLYMRDEMVKILGVDNSKVICIYNITRPLIIKRKPAGLTKRISIIGSIQKRKNQLDAIKMLNLIKDRNVILQIFGHPLKKEYMELLQGYIKTYKLTDRVIFKGIASEREIYENTDIAIMPSEHEGYPYIFFESASYNVPIVAYDFKFGAAEFSKDNANGCLIKMGDYKSMANVVFELLTDNEKYQKTIEFNKNTFDERYSEKSILDDYNKLFKNVNSYIQLDKTNIKTKNNFTIDNLVCESNSIEVKEAWDNKTIKKDYFTVSFIAGLNKGSSEFFYVYKKSKFPLNAIFEKFKNSDVKSLFTNKNISKQKITLNIPKKNRLSLGKEIESFKILVVVGKKQYDIAEIINGNIAKKENSLKDITVDLFGTKVIKDVSHILKPDGLYIRYPSFEVISNIKNEDGELLDFSTHIFRFYGNDTLFFKLKNGLYKNLIITMNSGKSLSIDFKGYSYKSVFNHLSSIEAKYNLFDLQIQNIFIWELIRATIFEHILEAFGVLDQHFSKSTEIQNAYFGTKSMENISLAEKLIFEFPRKKDIDYRTIAIQNQYSNKAVILQYPQ